MPVETASHAIEPDKRSQAIVNYLVLLLALARRSDCSEIEVIEWIHSHYEALGAFDRWVEENGWGAIPAAVDSFVAGRRLLYDDVSVVTCQVDVARVESVVWWLEQPVEAFFVFGLDFETLAAYSAGLAQRYYKRVGVDVKVDIDVRSGRETATFSRMPKRAETERLLVLRSPRADELPALTKRLVKRWGGTTMVVGEREHELTECSCVIATRGGLCGYAYFTETAPESWEILAIEAIERFSGVGTALLRAVEAAVERDGGRMLSLTTTNDNTDALRFYQRRGFTLDAVRRGAVTAARERKPIIPFVGEHGIPIRDEIELSKALRVPAEP